MKVKGTALQIVLFVFLVLLMNFSSLAVNVSLQARERRIKENINTIRLLEICLINHYKVQIDKDILLSNYYSIRGVEIKSEVDVVGDEYDIRTDIKAKDYSYRMHLIINGLNLNIRKLEYLNN